MFLILLVLFIITLNNIHPGPSTINSVFSKDRSLSSLSAPNFKTLLLVLMVEDFVTFNYLPKSLFINLHIPYWLPAKGDEEISIFILSLTPPPTL